MNTRFTQKLFMVCAIWIFYILTGASLYGQEEESKSALEFKGDFRFRIEHDWKSRRSDGSYRTDRSRLRFRARWGFDYTINEKFSFGARIRTGNINDQQGPHLTLGGSDAEFGLYQIAFDQAYFNYTTGRFKFMFGKYSFPFMKQDEIFWNDNVNPDGVAIKYDLYSSERIKDVKLVAAHFISNANGSTFDKDAYMQAIQLSGKIEKFRSKAYLSFYAFRNMSNIPDGKGSYLLDYSVINLGSTFYPIQNFDLELGFELFSNAEDYSSHADVPDHLKDERFAYVLNLGYGKKGKKNNTFVRLSYAHMDKFAIVDYFAQNDWARWDYSSAGAAGSRLTNFEGLELRVDYYLEDNMQLVFRAYTVEQLVTTADFTETGLRVRLDLDMNF